MKDRIIVSECVTNGHPDKIADRIADEILGEFYTLDPNTRAGIEVMVKDNIVVLGGEVTSVSTVDYDTIVRRVYQQLNFPEWHGLAPDKIKVINLLGKQSLEINSGVDREDGSIGAGDQGFVCGFATNETPEYLGLGQYIAKKICRFIERSEGFGPDGKSQVIVRYDSFGKAHVESILVSSMHHGTWDSLANAKAYISWSIVTNDVGFDKDIFENYIKGAHVVVNPCGEWHTGGPVADCGVTGRKIVVDQFGGYCSVGGGNLTGKDMSKVDRSGAYMARYLAKNIVASGAADTAKVELSYMIGVPEPSSMDVQVNDEPVKSKRLSDIILNNIDLTPQGIINRFGRVPYSAIACYGHYGVSEDVNGFDISKMYGWEQTDMTDLFKNV